MSAISRSIEVRASARAVLAVILDVASYPDWQREVHRAVVDETDEDGRPALTTITIRAVGQSGQYTVRYVYPAEHVVEYHLVRSTMMTRHDARFAVRERDGRCELTVAMDLALKWPLPTLVLDRLVAQGVRNMLRSVKRQAEG